MAALFCFSCIMQNKLVLPTSNDLVKQDRGEDELRKESRERTIQNASTVISVVKEGKEAISKIISYPLDRIYPIPPVRNEKDFLERYELFFDDELIQSILNSDPQTDWENGFGATWLVADETTLLLGIEEAYEEESPKIRHIPISDKELICQKALIDAERSELHESLSALIYTVCLMETDTYMIRIDCVEENEDGSIFRYAAWKRGSSISDTPDCILSNGIEGVEGSGGSTTYYFANGNDLYECHVGGYDSFGCGMQFDIYKDCTKADLDGWIEGTISEKPTRKLRQAAQLVYWSER